MATRYRRPEKRVSFETKLMSEVYAGKQVKEIMKKKPHNQGRKGDASWMS